MTAMAVHRCRLTSLIGVSHSQAGLGTLVDIIKTKYDPNIIMPPPCISWPSSITGSGQQLHCQWGYEN